MSLDILYPLEFYGRRNSKAPGLPYNPKCCAGEVFRGFNNKYQCKNKPGFGQRHLFCAEHSECKAKEVINEQ